MTVKFIVKVKKKEKITQKEVTTEQADWGVIIRVDGICIAAIQDDKQDLQLYSLPNSLKHIFNTDSRGCIKVKSY